VDTVHTLTTRFGRKLPVLGRAALRRLVLESGLFDAGYYVETHPEKVGPGFDALGHFLEHGAKERRDPSPFFRSRFYLAQNPDVAAAGVNPLVHYLTWGAREGRDPNPFFDTSFYLESDPKVSSAGVNPLTHFLTRGRREGREPVRRSGPRVHLYATCWNEIRLLGFFFRHYDPVVQRYVIYDDGSTDGSVDLLRGHPKVELRRFYRRDPDSFTLSERDLFGHCWKESRGFRDGPLADFVILCNIDEHLVHPDLGGYLSQCVEAGVTIVPALGFQMFTDEFPRPDERLCNTRTDGVPDHDDCKLVVFSPTAVQDINYRIGGHAAEPTGRLVAPWRDELMLQNYQLLGIDYVQRRFAELDSGMGPKDRQNGWGYHYRWSRQELLELFEKNRQKAVNTAAIRAEPWKGYVTPEWWKAFPRGEPCRP
jgi:Glycosyl transferase family 2